MIRLLRGVLALSFVGLCAQAKVEKKPASVDAEGNPVQLVDKFHYINLSTMIADWPEGTPDNPHGLIRWDTSSLHGEWGFSALVMTEVKGQKHRVLFDTGKLPYTVMNNAERLGLVKELCQTKRVVLSHTHSDHTGGLIALRQWLMKNKECSKEEQKTALTEAFVSKEFFRGSEDPEKYYNGVLFYDRPFEGKPQRPTDIRFKNEVEWVYNFLLPRYERAGLGKFIRIAKPTEVIPGVWAGGSVRSQMAKKSEYKAKEGQPIVVDDQPLVIMTQEGAVVISGCGHAGISNTLNFVHRHMFAVETPLVATLGGWHLFPYDSVQMKEVAKLFNDMTIRYFLGSHCSGLGTATALRELVSRLTNKTALNDTVGTQFVYDRGAKELFTILPGMLNEPRD